MLNGLTAIAARLEQALLALAFLLLELLGQGQLPLKLSRLVQFLIYARELIMSVGAVRVNPQAGLVSVGRLLIAPQFLECLPQIEKSARIQGAGLQQVFKDRQSLLGFLVHQVSVRKIVLRFFEARIEPQGFVQLGFGFAESPDLPVHEAKREADRGISRQLLAGALELNDRLLVFSQAVLRLPAQDAHPGRIGIKGFEVLEGAEGLFELFRLEITPLEKVARPNVARVRSEEHTSELQSLAYLVCRLLLEKKKI